MNIKTCSQVRYTVPVITCFVHRCICSFSLEVDGKNSAQPGQSVVVIAGLAHGAGDSVLYDTLAVHASAVSGLLDDHAGENVKEALLHAGAGVYLRKKGFKKIVTK